MLQTSKNTQNIQIQKLMPHMLKDFQEDLIASQSEHFTWKLQSILDSLKNGKAWVLLDDLGPQALCCFQGSEHEWELLFCLSRVRARGKGHMKSLLAGVLKGPLVRSKVYLEVHPNNKAAIKLYEALGFFQISERNQYYKDGASALIYRCDS